MVELKVNPGELAAGGRGLEEAAASIPEPLAPFTSTGTDALSTILHALTQQKEAPLIEGLPATKAAALKTAQNIVTAAGMYERSDQQIATDVTNASARLGGGSAGGASSGGGANAGGGASQMQQLLSMPMQVAQQVGQVASQIGQLPQGLVQGVQGGIQQIGQMIGGIGQSGGESEKHSGEMDDERSDGAASGHRNAERVPTEPLAHAQGPDAGIVL